MTIRRTLASAAALTALLALAACGGEASTTDAEADGPWTFTDDRDRVIKRDKTPTRIVAQSSVAGGLWDLGIKPVGAIGPLKNADGSANQQVGNLDPSKVSDVTGAGYGELDLEKLTETNPDLVVTHMYVPPELWYINDATAKKVEKLVPTLALNFKETPLTETFDLVENLAKKLGADIETKVIKDDRAAFDAATDRLKDLGTKLEGKKILAVSATPDSFYAGDIDQFPDLDLARDLGLDFVSAKAPEGAYWEELSWEKSDKYDADIILWDNRSGETLVDGLKAQPVFSTIKGAKNDAYVPWQAEGAASYKAYAKIFNELVDNLEKQL